MQHAFFHNDYTIIERGCMSEMIEHLNFEPLNVRQTLRRLTIFHKAINGHLALPIENLQAVLGRTRHLTSKAFNTPVNTVANIHSSPGQ